MTLSAFRSARRVLNKAVIEETEQRIAAKLGPEWSEGWPTLLCVVIDFWGQISAMAPAHDWSLVHERLRYLYDRCARPGSFEDEDVDSETDAVWFKIFLYGVATGLYWLWEREMDAQGVGDERLSTWEFPPDRLSGLDLPMEVAGATLNRNPALLDCYELSSKGPLGDRRGSRFRCEGLHAFIIEIVEIGRVRGAHQPSVPTERHVRALRKLGFKTMEFPNGKKYEL